LSLPGSYLPFAETRAERIESGDERLSLKERYPNHGAYVSTVSRAADGLVQERLLLQEDADRIIEEAAQSDIGKPQRGGPPR
jgi:hypothetical protein